MATKRKTAKNPRPKQLEVSAEPDEDKAAVLARRFIHPTFQAAATLMQYDKANGDLDPVDLVNVLTEQTEAAIGGDLDRAEATLAAQAHTLDAIFNDLARRAIKAKYMDNLDRYLKLALRAQSQCRATWEALSAIKNPPILYAKQANIAQGHQQVNNGNAAPSRAREIKNEQTQLSGGNHELLPDTRASGNESQVNPSLETLGEINRAKVKRG